MNKDKKIYFDKCVHYFEEINKANKSLSVGKKNDNTIYLIIDEVTKDKSGCGQCHTEYDTISITGKIWLDNIWQQYYASFDSYSYYDCECETSVAENILFFKLYLNDDYDRWLHLSICMLNNESFLIKIQ